MEARRDDVTRVTAHISFCGCGHFLSNMFVRKRAPSDLKYVARTPRVVQVFHLEKNQNQKILDRKEREGGKIPFFVSVLIINLMRRRFSAELGFLTFQ